MAEYTVTYNITANASSAITAFTELEAIASKLGAAAKNVNQMVNAVKNFNKALGAIKSKATINVRTGKSVKQLEALAAAANSAAAAVERVVAAQGMVGGLRGGGRTAAKTSKALAASTTRVQQATTSKAPSASSSFVQNGNANTYLVPQAGRTYRSPQTAVSTAAAPKVARSRVIPGNIMHRALGPAFLSNNGGALDVIKGMGIMYGLTGVGSAFAGAVSDYMDYNNIMTTTRAILGTHDKGGDFNGRFSKMENNIRKIGMLTKYTAPQVAAASKFLAMAGLDIESINKSMPAITDIALVADSDLSETADVVTNIMTAYQMKPDQMREVADKMTMAFTMSNTTLMEMAESYKYFASIAAHEGMDFTDTTAMIGLLGDAGLKGSHAGTTIRQIFNNLKRPNKSMRKLLSDTGIKLTGEDGKLRPLFDIFSDLSKNNALDKAFDIFRVTAAQGAVSLGDSTEKWLRMREAINNSSGISSSIAETRINNLQGLWKQIQSSFEDATFDALANYEPQVMNIMKQLIYWLQSSDGRNFVKELVGSIWDLVKAIGEITVVFVKLYRKFAPIINLWLKFKLAIMPIITIINVLRNLFNAGLGVAAFTRSFGKASLAVSGFVKGFTKGGLKAGTSAFNATMNGVAATAERTAMRVAAAGSVFATGGVPGVKTPLGYMTTGNMSPYSRAHYESQRNFYESNLMTRAQREQLGMLRQQITANNSMMNAVAASRWMPDFMKRNKLGGLRTANQSLTGKIRDIYNATKPTEKAWRVAQQRRALLNDERLRLMNTSPRKKLEELQRRFNSMKPPRSYKEREQWGRMKYKLAKMQRAYPIQQANWEANVAAAMQANQRKYEYWTNKEIERRRMYDFRLAAWNAAQQARAGAGGANQFFGGQSPTFSQRVVAIPSNIKNWWSGRKNWGTNLSNLVKNNPNFVNAAMGAGSIAGGVLGGILGNKFGNSDYSGLYWGTYGSILPMLLTMGSTAGPVGAAIGAIIGLGIEIKAAGKNAENAKRQIEGMAHAFKIENGYLSGDSASAMSDYYRLLYDNNLSVNQQLELRLKYLQKISDFYIENPVNDGNVGSDTQNKAYNDFQSSFGIINKGVSFLNLDTPIYKQYLDYFYRLTHGIFDENIAHSDGSLHRPNTFFKMPDGSLVSMPFASNGANLGTAGAMLYAGAQDSQLAKAIANWDERASKGTSQEWALILDELRQTREHIYDNIPEQFKISNWKVSDAESILPQEVRNTEFYRMSMDYILQKLEEQYKKRAEWTGIWETALKNGGNNLYLDPNNPAKDYHYYSGTDALAYFNSRANVASSMAYFKWPLDGSMGTPSMSNWYKGIGYNTGTQAFESLQQARAFLADWKLIKEQYFALNKREQDAPEIKRIYDLYQSKVGIAEKYIEEASQNMFDNMQLETPNYTITPKLSFDTSNSTVTLSLDSIRQTGSTIIGGKKPSWFNTSGGGGFDSSKLGIWWPLNNIYTPQPKSKPQSQRRTGRVPQLSPTLLGRPLGSVSQASSRDYGSNYNQNLDSTPPALYTFNFGNGLNIENFNGEGSNTQDLAARVQKLLVQAVTGAANQCGQDPMA